MAFCRFQRVNAVDILSISQRIETVISKLDDFVRTVEMFSSSRLRRISLALVKIRQLVVKDVDAMDRMVQNYMQAYEALLKAKIDYVLYFLDSSDFHLDYLASRMEKGPWDGSWTRDKWSYGWGPFSQAMSVFDVLRGSLISFKDISKMITISNLNDDVRRALPSSLWSSNERRRTCEWLFDREGVRFGSISADITRVLNFWERLQIGKEWPRRLLWRIETSKSKLIPLKQCANEYRSTITKTLDELSRIKTAAEDTLNTGKGFDFETFEGTFDKDLGAISATGSWLHGQIKKHTAHNISKLEFAEQFFSAQSKEDMVRYMETIFLKTDLEAVSKMRTEARELKAIIQKWFVAGLRAITYLLDFFDEDEVEYKMRNLSLWRQPIVDLRTADVLKYWLNVDDTWRTWPLSVSLRNLITQEGSQYISNILEDYMTGINEALYKVQETSLAIKDEAAVEFDVLWEELQSYKLRSEINDNFVR